MPTQFQANNLDYNDYVGRLAVGRVKNGTLGAGTVHAVPRRTAASNWSRSPRFTAGRGSNASKSRRREAGDIAAIAGIEDIGIGDTISRPRKSAGAAAAAHRRTDHRHAFLRQQFSLVRPRRRIRHLAQAARTTILRAAAQRQPARRGNRPSRTPFKSPAAASSPWRSSSRPCGAKAMR